MAVKEERPLTLSEVYSLVGESERGEKIRQFLNVFKPIEVEKAKQLKEELLALDIIKLKESHIIKIIDFLPEDATELNKILTDVSLDEAETNKILELVKKY